MTRITFLVHRGKDYTIGKYRPGSQKEAIRDLEVAPNLPNGCDSEPGNQTQLDPGGDPETSKGRLAL